jgi:hypothetical protein
LAHACEGIDDLMAETLICGDQGADGCVHFQLPFSSSIANAANKDSSRGIVGFAGLAFVESKADSSLILFAKWIRMTELFEGCKRSFRR